MLKKVSLRNFKAFGDEEVVIRCAPITLIYGPNSSGKSSILQSLLMLSQTFSNKNSGDLELVTNGEKADLGVYSSLIHKHDLDRELTIGLTLDRNVSPPDGFNPSMDEWASEQGGECTFKFDKKIQRPKLKSFTLSTYDSIRGLFRLKLLREPFSNVNLPVFRLPKNFNVLSGFYKQSSSAILSALEPFGMEKSSRVKLNRFTRSARKLTNHWFLKKRKGIDVSSEINRERINLIESIFNVTGLKSDKVREDFLTKTRFVSDEGYLPFATMRLDDDVEGIGARRILWMLERKVTPHKSKAVDALLRKFKDLSAADRARFLLEVEDPTERQRIDAIRLAQVFETSLGSFSRRAEAYLSNLNHIKPLRAAPTRFIDQTRERDLNIDEKFGAEINQTLKSIGFPYKISVHRSPDPILGNIQTIRLLDERINTEVALSDVGFGISQILPILRAGIVAKFGRAESVGLSRRRSIGRRKSLVLVEQPEIHIHPRAQAELAAFFADTIQDQRVPYSSSPISNSSDSNQPQTGEIQWVIETHSEALLLRLLKLIRKGVLKPHEISINYVSIDHKKQCASVKEIEVNASGEFLTEWPNGFFEERLEEIFD
jgi:hypothetical protein